MIDSDDGQETVEELRVELTRLKEELSLASREKIQAAEYGLVVLEEKQAIKQQCEDLELLYETSKQELQIAKEVIAYMTIDLAMAHVICQAINFNFLLQELEVEHLI